MTCITLAGESKDGTAKWYGTVMKKILEKGDAFVSSEITRLQKVCVWRRCGGGRGRVKGELRAKG